MDIPQQNHQACVLEVNDSEVIALTNDGEFITLPLQGKTPEIGDIVPVPTSNKTVAKVSNYKSFLAFAAAAAIFLLVFVPYLTSAQAVMWVSLDVNPSLELGLDKNQRVVDVEAINNDAKTVLENISIKDMQLNDAIPLLLGEMEKRHFIAPEKDNVVMMTFASEQGFEELQDNTEVQTKKLLDTLKTKKKIPIKGIYISKAQINERNLAHIKKLSFGKYALYKKAKEKGINVSINDLSAMPAAKAISKAGGNIGDLLEHKGPKHTDNKSKIKNIINKNEINQNQSKPQQSNEKGISKQKAEKKDVKKIEGNQDTELNLNNKGQEKKQSSKKLITNQEKKKTQQNKSHTLFNVKNKVYGSDIKQKTTNTPKKTVETKHQIKDIEQITKDILIPDFKIYSKLDKPEEKKQKNEEKAKFSKPKRK